MSRKVTDSEALVRAKRFRLYKWITLALLVLFLIGGFLIYQKEITVENLRYLLKYVNFYSAGDLSSGASIAYEVDTGNRYKVFRGDLAVVNRGGITLYDRSGSAVLSDSFSMTAPVVAAGEKYLIVYDLGGVRLRVYNSFSFLHEEVFDYAIQSVSVNGNGSFAVATAERSYHAAVLVFNNDFKEVFRWLSADRFVVTATLTDTDYLYVAAARVEDGALLGEMLELKTGKSEPISEFSRRDEMPLSVVPVRRGALYLTDKSLSYLSEGKEEQYVSFPSESLDMTALGSEVSAVAQNELSVGVNYKIRVFDREAKEIFSQNFSVPILDLQVYGSDVYLLTHHSLYCIVGGRELKEYETEGDYTAMGILGTGTVALCSATHADVYSFR